MISIIALIALYVVIHYGLKYNFGWTPIDFIYDLMGNQRAGKEKTRENLNVLINFINRAENVTEVETEHVKTILSHRNPLTELSKEDAKFVWEVLRDIAEKRGEYNADQRRDAAARLDAAVDKLL